MGRLDINNTTVFTIIKEIVLKNHNNKDLSLTEKLKPIDCAQFMTAFCRVGFFEDQELFEVLEQVFLARIEEASGETLVTIFTAHASWAQSMIEQCLVQKAHPKRVYEDFKRYNEEFYMHLATNLVLKISEINLKGILLVLAHGNMAHLKKRTNIRIMRQFAVKGIAALEEERHSLGDESVFEQLCVKYYDYALKYCLNKEDRDQLEAAFSKLLPTITTNNNDSNDLAGINIK